jgi:putative FmdB family regulatory protein
MPLYEYECAQCRKVFEVMQKFSDEPLQECETCKGPVKKLMSLSGFALKGSGWYTTDYKKSSAPAAPASTPAEKPAAATPAPAKKE